jgi:hypothetical protein
VLARYSGCGLDEVCGLVPPVPHYTPCPSPKAARGLGIGVAIVAKASSPTTLLPFPIRSQPISSPYTIPRAHWHLSNTSKLLARRVIPLPRLARADVPTTSMFVAVPQRQRTHALLLQLPHVSRGDSCGCDVLCCTLPTASISLEHLFVTISISPVVCQCLTRCHLGLSDLLSSVNQLADIPPPLSAYTAESERFRRGSGTSENV